MLIVIFRTDDAEAMSHAQAVAPALLQEGWGGLADWGKGFSALYHHAHVPNSNNKDHVHVFRKGKQLFAINSDGSAHDRSHGKVIPRHVVKQLKAAFPGIPIRPDRLIEEIADELGRYRRILTGVQGAQILPAEVVADCDVAIAEIGAAA